jgi:hypothetical protein
VKLRRFSKNRSLFESKGAVLIEMSSADHFEKGISASHSADYLELLPN